MDKLERLLNLTAALLATSHPLSAEELRERVGGYPESKAAFRRSFERDKDDLRSMGVPLRVEPMPGTDPPLDGYRIHADEYSGRDLRLEPDELAALHLATSLVQLEGGSGEGLRKLGSTSGTDEAASVVGHVPFDDALTTLVQAAGERRSVRFGYNGTGREVEPWKVSFSRGHWYLTGWDRGRDDERVYRVDRIEGRVDPSDPSVHPVRATAALGVLRGWELGDGTPVTARVLVDSDQAAWARHAIGTVGTTLDDGSVVFDLSVRNPDAFRSFVLTFLEHAEVIEPDDLRADLEGWLEAQL